MLYDKPPEKIYLQYHGDTDPNNEPVNSDDVTWCSDKIFNSDIEYVKSPSDPGGYEDAQTAEVIPTTADCEEALREIARKEGLLPASASPALLPCGFHPMATAPKDGAKIEILFQHLNYYYAGENDRGRWQEVCEAYWTDFNNGGWVWHGIAGVPICWRPTR
ncbi:MAG: hypothetical protein JAY90_20025 [Candidatus Thiodiazotropha lotti]|nr:hypothetical protein [Candidatus Thiodiazotropha lotti]